jgi:hypothetical protein
VATATDATALGGLSFVSASTYKALSADYTSLKVHGLIKAVSKHQLASVKAVNDTARKGQVKNNDDGRAGPTYLGWCHLLASGADDRDPSGRRRHL